MIKKLVLSAVAISCLPALLLADAITPESYTGTLNIGESITIRKTVTIDDAPTTTAPVDVMFLCDNTGSMGGAITAVRNNASAILSNISGIGDVQFAVGSYRDEPIPPHGSPGDYPFRLESDLTGDAVAAQAAINMWTASGGYDWPESQLYALSHSATDVSWRENSTRIIVWFGDATGHDPSAPGTPPEYGITEIEAIAALNAENIVVQAIDVGGLDADGQATRITAATDGTYYPTFNESAVVAEITAAVTEVFEEYSTVSLGVVGADNVSVTTSGPITGDFDRSVTNTFEFDVTITGVSEGVDDFEVHALVDGGSVAVESDRITVVTSDVPEPGSMLLLSLGFLSLVGYGIRRKK